MKDIKIFNINIFKDEKGKITGSGSFWVENELEARILISEKTHTFCEFKTDKKTLKTRIYLNI